MVDNDWNGFNWYTYVRLSNGLVAESFINDVRKLVAKNTSSIKSAYFLQRLEDIHLYSNIKSELERNSNSDFVHILAWIGVFILIVGLVNFINFLIVVAVQRYKEVGVYKVNGASAGSLFFSFFIEALFWIVLSICFSAFVIQSVLPTVNSIFGVNLNFDLSLSNLIFIVFVAISLTVITAAIPAYYYCRFEPLVVLKRSFQGDVQPTIRKVMVATQIFVTAIFLVMMLTISRQLDFIYTSDLGFEKEQHIVLTGVENGEAIKNELLHLPEIMNVSFASSLPGDQSMFFNATVKGSSKSTIIDYAFVDDDYFEVLGLTLTEGRMFSRQQPPDRKSFPMIINQTAARVLGIEGNAVGSKITPNPKSETPVYFEVIGVVKDFNFSTLYQEVKPYLFSFTRTTDKLIVKTTKRNQETIRKIEGVWKENIKNKPLDYYFLDDRLQSQYSHEEKFKNLLWLLTAITLFITCSGLISVASLLISRRQKEFGIRKVMGASVVNLFHSVCLEYLQLTLISIALSFPLAIYLSEKWLAFFAYKVPFTGQELILATITLFVATVLMISYQSLKMLSIAPAESLRHD